MKPDKYRGIIPAFYVCYDRAGEISGDGMRALIRYLVGQGVKGVYVDGSSGKCIYQSVEDGEETPEAAMDGAAGHPTVIAYVTCDNTRDSRILAAYAQSLGADRIAVIPPIYFKLPEYSAAGYWNDILEAVPDTDLIIYNIPQLVGAVLTMSLLRTMFLNGHVVGVKNSSMPVQDIQIFKAGAMKTREDFIVFSGSDEQLVSGLAIGVDRGVGGTYGAMPELLLEIYDLVSENGMVEIRATQYDASEVMYELRSGTYNMYAMIREVLRVSKGIDIGGMRKPLTDSCDGDRAIAGEAAVMIETAKEKYC